MLTSARMAEPGAALPQAGFLADATIEMTAKDTARLAEAVGAGFRPAQVFIPFLPGERTEDRVAATRAVRDLGIDPVPHISARRLGSRGELEAMLGAMVDAGATRFLLIGGDPAAPLGPYGDSLSVIRDMGLRARGIACVALAGHPEGHPNMTDAETTAVLAAKIAALQAEGVASEIVTQFSFDPDRVAGWIAGLRAAGIGVPVAVGLPGPTKVTTLLKFAARCGVGASAKAVAKYGFSLTKVLGSAGPETFVAGLQAALGPAAGPVRAHLYPFGGFAETARWLRDQP